MNDKHRSGSNARGSQPAARLPLQNLLLAAAVIGGVSCAAQFLNAQTAFPFGNRQFGASMGTNGVVGWTVGTALVDVVALLSARGVAKFLLLPRREHDHYGYWLLALSVLLGTLPLVGLDLFTTQAMRWWRWQNRMWHWQGIALPNLAGWLFVNALALLLATPALIDKRPSKPPPKSRPLVVWFALNAVCLVACVSRASDAAVAVLAAPVLAVTMLAFQQHRRASASLGKQA